MTSDHVMYTLSVLTCLAFKLPLSLSEATSVDISSDSDSLQPLYPFLDDESTPEKRRSLLRFGKRRSLFRFGKRGTILRFGKRPDDVDLEDNVDLPIVASGYVGFQDDPRSESAFVLPDKKGSIFRFGKKSRDMVMRHSTKEKKPHTPWRFGREYYYTDDFSLHKE